MGKHENGLLWPIAKDIDPKNIGFEQLAAQLPPIEFEDNTCSSHQLCRQQQFIALFDEIGHLYTRYAPEGGW